jgi:hypothetical protein
VKRLNHGTSSWKMLVLVVEIVAVGRLTCMNAAWKIISSHPFFHFENNPTLPPTFRKVTMFQAIHTSHQPPLLPHQTS